MSRFLTIFLAIFSIWPMLLIGPVALVSTASALIYLLQALP